MKKMLLVVFLISFVGCCNSEKTNFTSLEDACEDLKWLEEEERPFFAIRDHVIYDEREKLPFESIESVLEQWHQENSQLGSYMIGFSRMQVSEEIKVFYIDMFLILAYGQQVTLSDSFRSQKNPAELPKHIPACYERTQEVVRVLKKLGAKQALPEDVIIKNALLFYSSSHPYLMCFVRLRGK